MELDIDFENYSVDGTRKSEVKSFVDIVKQEPWVHDLKTLLNEYGAAPSDNKSDPSLFAGLEAPKDAKIFKLDPATQTAEGVLHPAIGILVEYDGTILRMAFENEVLLEVSFLPKGSEFAVYFINEPKFDVLKEKIALLEAFVKEAKSKKSARQAGWKARFETN
jgi:hypothetical protein